MKIAIHNHYAGQAVSETEFSKRISKAAANLGWDAAEVGSSSEIARFQPDFVIALHFRTPKLTKYRTYGAMVSPPVYFVNDEQFIKNILSYDGYLCSSDTIAGWLRDALYLAKKKYLIAPWYITCQSIPYTPPELKEPRLFYSGSNWDGSRYAELFQELDKQPYMAIYGPASAWTHLHRSYRGSLPFDGESILTALNKAGVGLCLHRKEHCDAATPSSRIFEITASGAIAICQEHRFIRDAFRDSVLYLESTDDPARTTAQISEYMKWIANNPEKALELSKKAYDLFAQQYTLEKFLSDLGVKHQQLSSQKPGPTHPRPLKLRAKSVQLIVRVGDRDVRYIERALDSIRRQEYESVGAIVVQYKQVAGLSTVLDKFRQEIPLQIVESSYTGSRSSQLWDGLRAVSADFFGILDDDDLIYPSHVDSLVQLLERFSDRGVAYSGSIRVWEPDLESGPPADLPSEPAELMYFEPFDLGRLTSLDNFITSNSFLARTSVLKDLGDDPQLPLLEDLFLLLLLCQKTDFVFSYEATCEFRWREHKTDNSIWIDQQHWAAARKRIEQLLWKRSLNSTQQIGGSSLSQLEAQMETRLAQMETILNHTKAATDANTARLDRYLNLPLVQTFRRIRRKLFRLPPPTHS